jgi:nucleoside-diphosphate-sugar epimerase
LRIRWLAPVHPADFAAVAVATLTRDEHAGKVYIVTGPGSLTHAEQIRLIGEARGRPLRFEELDEAAARQTISPYAPADVLFETWQKHLGDARTGHRHDRAGYWPATAVCQAMGRRLPDLSCIHTATAAPAIGGRGRCPPPNVTLHPAVSSLR